MLNPHRLTVLRAVLAAGSINKAAANLNYSPATISQHVQALAGETGLVLFEKQGRGIVATDAARHLAEESESLLADFGRLERVVADLRGGQKEHLAIACFASAAEQWIPQLVREVHSLQPQLTVEVSLNEPLDGRGRRRPDLDIRTEPVGRSLSPGDGQSGAQRDGALQLKGYARHDLAVEELVAVLPAGHPLSAGTTVALGALEHEPWVDHDIYDSPIGRIVLNACAAAGFTPRYAARLDDHRTALRLIAAGVGVTLLPRLAAAELPPGAVARPLSDASVKRRIVVHTLVEHRRGDLIAFAVEALRRAATTAPVATVATVQAAPKSSPSR